MKGSHIRLAVLFVLCGVAGQSASTAGATGGCWSPSATRIEDPGDRVVFTAPAGEVVAEVAIKAGRKCFVTPEGAIGVVRFDDCYVVEGLATAEATVLRVGSGRGCKDISHVQFATTPAAAELCGNGLDDDRDGIVDDGCIAGRAWLDWDRDGIQDVGESGFAGVPFRLRTGDGTLVAATVSDANGNYQFGNVVAGSYVVEAPTHATFLSHLFSLTGPNRGSDDSKDSDFEIQLADRFYSTAVFAFPTDGVIDHIDAGYLDAAD